MISDEYDIDTGTGTGTDTGTSTIPIDRNIPLTGKDIKRKYPWEKMEVGDSFFLDAKEPDLVRNKMRSLTSAYWHWRKRNKRTDVKFSVRAEGKTGVRCWRVE